MTTEAAQSARLSGEDVEAYFQAGFPTRRKVLDVPETYLEFDPLQEEIRLRAPASQTDLELTGFERITVQLVDELGVGQWVELRVDAEDKHHEAYLVLASVVDLMRGGLSFAAAIFESVDSFRELLRRKQKLTEEAQIGLFGELLMVEHVLKKMPAEDVISAWLGPEKEEHDFVFNGFDAEVKTTRGEARVHLITSSTQLEPTLAQPLYLVSVQVTGGGLAEKGRTLDAQIGIVREFLNPQLARVFQDRLKRLGWNDGEMDLYPKRWALRTGPRVYLVDGSFPAITTSRLQHAVPQSDLLVSLQYRVDVTNLDPSIAPELLTEFVAPGADE